MLPRLLLWTLVLVATLTVAACGTAEESSPSSEASSSSGQPGSHSSNPGMEHIHGLGIGGDTLYIATHTGLWSVPDNTTKARPVGTSRRDVMGFSVLGPEHFIGSGHPDPSESAPANLGLIESRDRGRTWRTISLSGEADFHVLESSGARVYGFDGPQGRLMVSSDAGRSWQQRSPPAGVFSLAIDPDSADRIVLSTERGLFVSGDAGKSFRPLQLREQLAGLLRWPTQNQLFLVEGNGQVQLSDDAGLSWQRTGDIDGQPAAFISHGPDLYAALLDGSVKSSGDGGRTWALRAEP